MSRIQIPKPDHYPFYTLITVRIDDLNYGNHLSNHCFLKFMHEARLRYLQHLGLNEMDIGGCSVIMGDAAIKFQQECFYGDIIKIEIVATEFSKKSFDFFYRFTRESDQRQVCEAKTGMVCYDYSVRKTVNLPESFIQLVAQAS